MATKKAAPAKKAPAKKALAKTRDNIPAKNQEAPQAVERVAESVASIEEPKEATRPANVIWSSERIYEKVSGEGETESREWISSPTDSDKTGILKFGDPPPFVRIGMLKIEVPEAAVQLKGFYSEHARLLIRSIAGYKALVPKG